MTAQPDILVVGAGTTGLTLALQAHDHGARVRIVERRTEVFRPSRALIVHARTLEVLRPLGVVDGLLARAQTSPKANLYLGHRRVPVELGGLPLRDTAFPHLSLLRQTDIETVLGDALAERGIQVERGTELTGLDPPGGQDGGCLATLNSPAGSEQVSCGFVVGCDGHDSTVRTLSRIDWRGGPYRQEVVLADIELRGELAPGVAHVVAGRHGLLFVFPIGERARWRLLATRPASGESQHGPPEPPVPAGELQGLLDDANLDAQITDVRWSSRIRPQHRLAAAFRHGERFLAGDAAHTHSPGGGQGMNTGIQDAINLGWKAAFAPHSSHPDELLDSYQDERRPVARRAIALTDLVFWAESSTDPLATFLRAVLAPLAAPLLPFILSRQHLIAEGFRVLSQLRVSYRGSPLSVDTAPRPPGWPRAGARLPDATVTADQGEVRLHDLTARPGVHVLLFRDAAEPGPGRHAPLVHWHRLRSTPGTGAVIVRPDGYVGLRSGHADLGELDRWLARSGASRKIYSTV